FHAAYVVLEDAALLIVVASTIHRRYLVRGAGIGGQLAGYERHVDGGWVVLLNGQQHTVDVQPGSSGSEQTVTYRGKTYRVVSSWQFGQPLFRGTVNGQSVCIQVERRNMVYRLFHWGAQVDVMVLTQRAAELLACMPAKAPPDMSKYLLSPMPGLLSQLMVEAGHAVKPGQDLAVVEAMKMQNVLRAERDGKIAKVHVGVGDSLAVDQVILEFE
ncbi:MAG: biotin/lipoyl-containing protein, partial [Pirellulales bacterium]